MGCFRSVRDIQQLLVFFWGLYELFRHSHFQLSCPGSSTTIRVPSSIHTPHVVWRAYHEVELKAVFTLSKIVASCFIDKLGCSLGVCDLGELSSQVAALLVSGRFHLLCTTSWCKRHDRAPQAACQPKCVDRNHILNSFILPSVLEVLVQVHKLCLLFPLLFKLLSLLLQLGNPLPKWLHFPTSWKSHLLLFGALCIFGLRLTTTGATV